MPAIKTDYNKFNEQGLKPVVNRFKKAGLPVERVEATNKPKREAGYQVKTAHIIFEDGQKITIKTKADGDIFQVKLNNKVMPMKHEDDLGKAIAEIVVFVKANATKFAKNKEKREQKMKIKPPPAVLKITSALPDRIKTANQTYDDARESNEIIDTQLSDIGQSTAEKSSELSSMTTELRDLESGIDKLKKELTDLQEAA